MALGAHPWSTQDRLLRSVANSVGHLLILEANVHRDRDKYPEPFEWNDIPEPETPGMVAERERREAEAARRESLRDAVPDVAMAIMSGRIDLDQLAAHLNAEEVV